MTDELVWGATEEVRGLRVRRFVLHRGARLVPGLLWHPDPLPGPAPPVVLVGHGGSGHKEQDYVVYLARRLARQLGAVAVSIDGPVHGERRALAAGEALRLLEFSQAWSNDETMTDEMVADWRGVLDAVTAEPGLGGGPVGYWGLSMGTILGLPLVAAEPRIEVAVLGLMGMIGPTRDRIAEDAPRVVCPVLFLVQLDDELFSPQRAYELFDALGSADKRLHAHPGAHGAVPAEEFAASVEFLHRYLRPQEHEAGDRAGRAVTR